MASATFDGPTLTIQLPSVGTFDVQRDLYSAWKVWASQGDNLKYPKAFDTLGGDTISAGQEVSPYFFLRNDLGWRIRSPEANGEVALQGNLFSRDNASPSFVEPGGFTTFLRLEVSSRAITVNEGTGALTPTQETALFTARDHARAADVQTKQ